MDVFGSHRPPRLPGRENDAVSLQNVAQVLKLCPMVSRENSICSQP